MAAIRPDLLCLVTCLPMSVRGSPSTLVDKSAYKSLMKLPSDLVCNHELPILWEGETDVCLSGLAAAVVETVHTE